MIQKTTQQSDFYTTEADRLFQENVMLLKNLIKEFSENKQEAIISLN